MDLMVVGDLAFEEVVSEVHRAHERLRREVNPVVMAATEFDLKRQSNDRFVSRIMAEPKMILLGELHES